MSRQDPLQAIRERIDTLDEDLQRLINERAALAKSVAEIKRTGEEEPQFYRPEREAQVLRKVMERNQGPMPAEEMARLFRELMSACLALEQPMKIAYFGPAGSYTHMAALRHFGHSVTTVPLANIDEVFREVAACAADFGVVPVENSTEGVITHTLDMFMNSSLKICGEHDLRIHHMLLAKGGTLHDIRRVYAHSQALAQCREWLDANLPGVQREAVTNNAEGARLAAGETGAAAIAGETAAELYGLDILATNIEDEFDNTTRFLVIGRQSVPPSGRDKTSLLVSAANKPGALYRLISPFERHGISMTRLESRPSRRARWEYMFFIDIEGHVEDEPVARALAEVEHESAMLTVLGSYPRAVL